MENNVLLGAIDAVGVPTSSPVSLPYTPTGGNIDLNPTPSPSVGTGSGPGTIRTGGGMVTLPTDSDSVTFFEGGPSGGGGATMPLEEAPAETPEAEAPKMSSKKNLLLFGIGGLVLAYLLFRKK